MGCKAHGQTVAPPPARRLLHLWVVAPRRTHAHHAPMATPKSELELVHRFVPGKGANARTTLLLLHGTGGDENDLVPLGESLLPGASILSPRGAVSERGAPRFFKRLAEGVFDLEDLALRTQQLMRF